MAKAFRLDDEQLEPVARCISHAAERQGHVQPSLIPSLRELALMLEAAYWATLIPDEGRLPRFSIELAPSDVVMGALTLPPKPLTPEAIEAGSRRGRRRRGAHRGRAGDRWFRP